MTLRTAHVGLSKRIFRLNQCMFSIVLDFWQCAAATVAGEERHQVRVGRIRLFDPGQSARHGKRQPKAMLTRQYSLGSGRESVEGFVR